MKRRFVGPAVIVAALAVLGLAPQASAQAVGGTQTIVIPEIGGYFINSCGEDMLLNGIIRLVIHTIADSNGGFHLAIEQSQAVMGTGLSTGSNYRVVQIAGTMVSQGATLDTPYEVTMKYRFLVIGAGPNNNVMAYGTSHLTIDANGVWRATFDFNGGECNH
ncbi:MAG TPA: hypothetical protein VLM91_03895 [Candidatus Methylomirabilis sp.]|nr:hypothetical protein [Candidatus Methylomirabilis sp.]